MLNTLWMKTWRDLWQNRGRSALVILSITLSTFTLGVILNSYAILSREMTNDFLKSNPTAISFNIERFDEDLLQKIAQQPAIDKVDARRQITGEIKTQNGEWKPLLLFVLHDYKDIKLDVLRPEQGSWPPGNKQILIERQAVTVLGANVGEQVQLKTSAGLVASLEMSGTTHDVGLAQAEWENIVYGYISAQTLLNIGEQAYFNQLKVSLKSSADGQEQSLQQMASAANQLKVWLSEQQYQVSNVKVAPPGEHPHANITGGMFMIQKVFAVLCCLLSAVLVFNLMSAMLSKHIAQIGVMKAIGASNQQVSQIYYRSVIVLGIIGMLLSLPLAYVVAIWYVDMLLPMMNFNVESYRVPLWVLLIEIGMGIGVPMVAAFVPIKKASQLTIRETFMEYNQQQDHHANWFERLVYQLSFSSPAISLAVRNSIRNRSRFILTMGVLAFAAALLMATFNITRTMNNTIAVEQASKNWGIALKFKQNVTVATVVDMLKDISGITATEAFNRSPAAIIDTHDESTEQSSAASDPHKLLVTLTKLKPGSTMLNMPVITGRWLSDDNAVDLPEVVVSQMVIKHMPELEIGMSINIESQGNIRLFKLVGIVRNIGAASIYTRNTETLISANGLYLSTTTQSRSSLNQLRKTLYSIAEQRGVPLSYINTAWQSVDVVEDHFEIIFYLMMLLTVIIIFIASNGIMLTMMTNIIERTRENGVLKAVGASNKELAKMLFFEAVFIGVLAWLVGCFVTLPLSFVVAYSLGILLIQTPFELVLQPMVFLYTLPITVVVTTIASMIPMKNMMKMPVREALIYE
ncbi:ABC transporter permease [Colwelliaceae bacterium 6471]